MNYLSYSGLLLNKRWHKPAKGKDELSIWRDMNCVYVCRQQVITFAWQKPHLNQNKSQRTPLTHAHTHTHSAWGQKKQHGLRPPFPSGPSQKFGSLSYWMPCSVAMAKTCTSWIFDCLWDWEKGSDWSYICFFMFSHFLRVWEFKLLCVLWCWLKLVVSSRLQTFSSRRVFVVYLFYSIFGGGVATFYLLLCLSICFEDMLACFEAL